MSILNADGSIADGYANFIAVSRYARWRDDLGRRETWSESVDRYMDFMLGHLKTKFGYVIYPPLKQEIGDAIKNLDIVPSMRALMTAGLALERSNVAGYNCSYLPVDDLAALSETLFILLNGTGVGFSVEHKYVDKLPRVPEIFQEPDVCIRVGDSKLGWAEAYKQLIDLLWVKGISPSWDFSGVRPAGSRLKTFGGRASGPEPLAELFQYTADLLWEQQGRRLRPIQVHDLMCKIASVVVVGGVRRAAMISLSDLFDREMAEAKSGEWYKTHPHRALANNSAVYDGDVTHQDFEHEWLNLMNSGSGERGIFSRKAARRQASQNGLRTEDISYGVNPCAEILLRPNQFCNLSEVIVRPEDTERDLRRKVKLATILGTWQATLTDFPFLRPIWQENTEAERLLGVSLTGIFGNRMLTTEEGREDLLADMWATAQDTNVAEAQKIGIPRSAAITTVKPSGCRPWYALTTTDQGVLTLEEMFAASGHSDGAEWQEFGGYKALQGTSSSQITKTYDNGTAPVLRIRTSYGIEVESTPNHQWWVKQRYDRTKGQKLQEIGEWTRADELVPGDILEIVPGTYASVTEAPLLHLDSRALSMRGDATQIMQPDTMNPEIGWLLGYLWGDGAMSPGKYRIRFIDEVISNLERAQRILRQQFGITSELKAASGGRKAMTLDIGSKMLWHWLIKNGVWKYYADKLDVIPEVVRRSSAETIIAFIAGLLDADGHVQARRVNGEATSKTVTLATADEAFAKHVQNVALSVGLVMGRSHNTGGTNKQAKKSMYLMQMNAHTLSGALDVLVSYSLKMATQHTDLPWITEVQDKGRLFLGKVESVEDIGSLPTFDIEVADTHWYYAGSVKSHNTVSQLAGVSSGIHPWHSRQYIRTVRADAKDPLAQLMKDYGVPNEPDAMQPDSTTVFSFPIKAPDLAVTRDRLSAVEHLEHWLAFKRGWCDHNPSVTISVREGEWHDVSEWVWQHLNELTGVSFLPYSEHVYKQAPYQEIDYSTWRAAAISFPQVRWADLSFYELTDTSSGAQTLACAADGSGCDSADLVTA